MCADSGTVGSKIFRDKLLRLHYPVLTTHLQQRRQLDQICQEGLEIGPAHRLQSDRIIEIIAGIHFDAISAGRRRIAIFFLRQIKSEIYDPVHLIGVIGELL